MAWIEFQAGGRDPGASRGCFGEEVEGETRDCDDERAVVEDGFSFERQELADARDGGVGFVAVEAEAPYCVVGLVGDAGVIGK